MTVRTLLAVATVLCGARSFAQELELDLSEPDVPMEFRPTLAVLPVRLSGASEPALQARAKLIEEAALKAAQANTAFAKVLSPAEAASFGLETPNSECADYACLQKAAEALKVNRVVSITLTKAGAGSTAALYAFDPSKAELVTSVAESAEAKEQKKLSAFAGISGKSQAQRDREFVARVKTSIAEVLDKVTTPLFKLSVDSIDSSSTTLLNGRPAGTGSFDAYLDAVPYELRVDAVGYLPFEKKLSPAPKSVETVRVVLVAKPIERKDAVEVVQRPTGPAPWYGRPGLYIAAAGVVAAVIGITCGLQAAAIQGRAIDSDGDGAVDIRRTDADTARRYATAANVLVPVGAVLAAGGATWFFLTPVFSKPAAPTAPEVDGAGFGVMASFGGTFP